MIEIIMNHMRAVRKAFLGNNKANEEHLRKAEVLNDILVRAESLSPEGEDLHMLEREWEKATKDLRQSFCHKGDFADWKHKYAEGHYVNAVAPKMKRAIDSDRNHFVRPAREQVDKDKKDGWESLKLLTLGFVLSLYVGVGFPLLVWGILMMTTTGVTP